MQTFLKRALALLPELRRAGRRLTRNDADVDDLVQETLARAISSPSELRQPERTRAWLLTIQRNVHLNTRRGPRPQLEVVQGGLPDDAHPVAEHTPESELMARTLSAELTAALETLPPEAREALWLREVDELTYEEIARVQGCPVGTVRSRLARARRGLQDALGGEVLRARM